MASRLLLAGICAFVVPSVVHAQDPAGEDLEAAADYEHASALYQEGVGRYETADYLGAIDLWTQAFTLLPNTAQYAKTNADLIYNLARAHEHQFDVDNDPVQLRQALILLDRYVESLPDLYMGDLAEFDAQKTRSSKVRSEIAQRLDAHEAGASGSPVMAPAAPARSKLVILGASFTALGAVALGVSGYGMVAGAQANDISDLDPENFEGRRDQFERGRTLNTIAIAGGVAAGVFLAAGVSMLVIGKRRNIESSASLTPWFSGRGAGVSASGHF